MTIEYPMCMNSRGVVFNFVYDPVPETDKAREVIRKLAEHHALSFLDGWTLPEEDFIFWEESFPETSYWSLQLWDVPEGVALSA